VEKLASGIASRTCPEGRVTADLAIRECPAGDEKEHCETEFATANVDVAENVGVPLVGREELRDRASSGGNS
jgi:hypothetical protein